MPGIARGIPRRDFCIILGLFKNIRVSDHHFPSLECYGFLRASMGSLELFTLMCLIKGYALLLISEKNSTLDPLIRVCPFINF